MLFSATNLYSQSGEKWSSGLNDISLGYRLGTKNNFSLVIAANNISYLYLNPTGYFGNVSDPLAPLHFDGDIIFNSLAGTTTGLIYSETNGKLRRISLTGNNRHVLLGDGTFDEYWDSDWLVVGNNMFAMPTGTVSFGVENPDTSYKVIIGGDTKIQGELSIGNSIKLNGITDQITTTTGTLDFGNTNIVTTGNINANQVNLSGNATLDNVTINTLTVNDITTTKKLVSNTSIDLKSALRFTGTNSAIVSTSDLKVETQGNVIINTTGNTTINGKTGIGTDEPTEMLDIDGNCNIRGYLYVQDGVIIGRRITGERVSADTVEIAQKLNAKEIEATEKIKTSNITIDGENSKITSTTGNINFDNENLTTSGGINTANISTGTLTATSDINCDGTITAANINAQNMTINTASYNKLQVNNSLTVGTNTMILSSEQGETTVENKISTDGGDLKIQCESISIPARNTLINTGNNGNVGIGTLYPMKKLHVKTSELSEVIGVGEFGGTIRLEHELQGITSSVWDISPTAVTSTGYLNRLDFIAPEESAIPILSLVKNGKVGVGTTAPKEQLEVTGAIKIGTTENINPGTIRFKNNEFEGNTNGTADGWKSLTDNGVWTKVGTTNNIEYTAGNVTIGSGSTGGLTVKGIKAAAGTTQMVTVDENGVFNKENIPSMADICDAITCGDNEVAINKKLTVNGNVSFVNSANFNYSFQIGNTIPKRRGISIDDDPNGTVNFWIHEWQNNSAFNFMLNKNADGTNTSKLMTINENGNVAIGNPTTIDAKLHVAGDVKIETIPDFTSTTETPSMLVYGTDKIIRKQALPDISTLCSAITCNGSSLSIGYPNTNNFYLNVKGLINFEFLPDKNADTQAKMVVKGTDGLLGIHDLPDICSTITCDNEKIGIGNLSTKKLNLGMLPTNSTNNFSTSYLGFNLKYNMPVVYSADGFDSNVGEWKTEHAGNNNGGSAIINSLNGDMSFVTISNQNDAQDLSFDDTQFFSKVKMIITSDGKVGIGKNIDDISADLQLYNDASDNILSLERNVFVPGHNETHVIGDGEEEVVWVNDYTDYSKWDIVNEGKYLRFKNGGTKLTITKTGNISIGQPTDYNYQRFQIIGTDDNSTNLVPIFFNNSSGAAGLKLKSNSAFWVINATGTDNYQGAGKLNFHCDSVDIMTLQKNGNVGIGTTSPSAKLDVIGDLSISSDAKIVGNVLIGTQASNADIMVNGNVWAREVKVRNQYWSDFVFKPNYDLMPLSELENFIQKNNHLPNIPTEKEVLENGNSLGKTDALLLQKIEELTLYLLQLKNENQTLKDRVDCLENK